MATPQQLILEKELLNRDIKKVLFYHQTDRWYFGDLLRHAAWIKALVKKSLEVTVATKADFLTIFENDPDIKNLYPVDSINERDLLGYDLVVIPSSFKPTYYSPWIRRGIYSFNEAMQYTRYGIVLQHLAKNDLNYFHLAKPHSGQTYLSDGQYYKIRITDDEKKWASASLRQLFGPKLSKIIIVNPTASNTFTRESTAVKEVENRLEPDDYLALINNLISDFPGHKILVAAALKQKDQENFSLIKNIQSRIFAQNVRAVTEITTLDTGMSIRSFAALLVDQQVVGMIGNGTGTNTHLAASLDVPAMSIERSADNQMKENWRTPQMFQMGSFRWRNPATCVAAYVLDFSRKTPQEFAQISACFRTHLWVNTKNWTRVFKEGFVREASRTALRLCKCIEDSDLQGIYMSFKTLQNFFADGIIKDWYFNFRDEAAYLSIRDEGMQLTFNNTLGAVQAESNNKDLIISLIRDSNLHKLCCQLSGYKQRRQKMSAAELIFRKMRAGRRLSAEDLKLLRFSSEAGLANWLNREIGPLVDLAIDQYPRIKKNMMPGAWQQVVYCDPALEFLLKKVQYNRNSVYLTDEWCLEGMQIANANAGGLIPHQTELRNIDGRHYHLARKIKPFMYKSNPEEVILNRDIFPTNVITEAELPLGWIDESLNNFLMLIRQKVYNVDLRLIDTGIDEFGIFYALDSGSFKKLGVKRNINNKLADPWALGVNQFALNRVLLTQFKNGEELVNYFDARVKAIIGLDLSTLSLEWKWGDHSDDSLKPLIDKFRFFVQKKRRGRGKPVYPFISRRFESLIFTKIKERLLNG